MKARIKHELRPFGGASQAWCGPFVGRNNQYNGDGKPCARCAKAKAAHERAAAKKATEYQAFLLEPRAIVVLKQGQRVIARFHALDKFCLKEAERFAKYASSKGPDVLMLVEKVDYRWDSTGEVQYREFCGGSEVPHGR